MAWCSKFSRASYGISVSISYETASSHFLSPPKGGMKTPLLYNVEPCWHVQIPSLTPNPSSANPSVGPQHQPVLQGSPDWPSPPITAGHPFLALPYHLIMFSRVVTGWLFALWIFLSKVRNSAWDICQFYLNHSFSDHFCSWVFSLFFFPSFVSFFFFFCSNSFLLCVSGFVWHWSRACWPSFGHYLYCWKWLQNKDCWILEFWMEQHHNTLQIHSYTRRQTLSHRRAKTTQHLSQWGTLICATHLNKSQKQEHLKIHILFYFQNVYVLMTAVFFIHIAKYFFSLSKIRKNTFEELCHLADRAAYNHYASFFKNVLIFF